MPYPFYNGNRVYNRNIPVLAISKLLKTELICRYSLPEHRIYVVYPGVDAEEFKPDLKLREKTRKVLNLHKPTVLFVGSQWGRKGLRYLLEAVSGLDVTLLVVGGKGEGLSVEGFPANVEFLGQRDDGAALYNAADIFVLPTLFDVFGLPVLETMACSIPVIVSQLAGASEIVADSGLIIENPRNSGEIRGKIQMLMR